MEVILLERIERLGQMGDIVKVKPGYARNYLLPRKKALRATEDNRRHFENQRVQLEATNLKRRQEAESVGSRLQGLELLIIRQAGEGGQLYGSVGSRDIAESLEQAGFTVARQQIDLNRTIKALGVYPCRVALHPEVIVSITLNVARSEEEAAAQKAAAEVEAAAPQEEKEEKKKGRKAKAAKGKTEEKAEGDAS